MDTKTNLAVRLAGFGSTLGVLVVALVVTIGTAHAQPQPQAMFQCRGSSW